jgi:radical SAM superfamily enzyme YgiQ (UPF0313 family)
MTPHLGLAYLAAVSEERGDEVRIFDADVEEQPLADLLREFRPHIAGITANTPQVKQAWRTAAAIKEILDIPVVLGGPHPSVVSEELDFESLSKPGVDFVVRGEGEGAWVDICNQVDSFLRDQPQFATAALMDPARSLWHKIEGVSFKTSDGQLHRNLDRLALKDLDSLPWPAYHLFKMDRYTNLQPATDHVDGARSFAILTSRGCPYRCTFCSQSIMPIKWRARDPENVLAEWSHLVRDFRAEEIGVLDDSANIRMERLHDLADLLIKDGLNRVPWIFVNGIRANLATQDLLAKLKQAGLKRTAFGVESGDPDIMRSIDKHIKHETITAAFQSAKAVGLETIGFFIIGLPGDTRETMQRTIDFACQMDPLIANFSMMTPYPGTKVYEIAKREGRLLVQDWEDYVFFDGRARYEIGEMTAELQEEMWRKAYRQFYLRPHRVVQTLMRKDFWLNYRRTFRVAFRTIFPKREKTELREQRKT